MFEIGSRVTVHDRKMKTHSMSGEVIFIDETLEKKKIYGVIIELRNIEDKLTGKKRIMNFLEDQLNKELIIEVKDV